MYLVGHESQQFTQRLQHRLWSVNGFHRSQQKSHKLPQIGAFATIVELSFIKQEDGMRSDKLLVCIQLAVFLCVENDSHQFQIQDPDDWPKIPTPTTVPCLASLSSQREACRNEIIQCSLPHRIAHGHLHRSVTGGVRDGVQDGNHQVFICQDDLGVIFNLYLK